MIINVNMLHAFYRWETGSRVQTKQETPVSQRTTTITTITILTIVTVVVSSKVVSFVDLMPIAHMEVSHHRIHPHRDTHLLRLPPQLPPRRPPWRPQKRSPPSKTMVPPMASAVNHRVRVTPTYRRESMICSQRIPYMPK